MIRRPIRQIYCFISTHPTLHHAGVYALLLVAMLETIGQWPLDIEFIYALVDHQYLITVDLMAWGTATWTVVIMGLIGVMRRSRIDRVAGAIALAPGLNNLGWFYLQDQGGLAWLYDSAFGLLVEKPMSLALGLANELVGASTFLCAIYFLLVWIVLRLAFALTRDRANALAARFLQRWNPERLAGIDA